MAVSAHPDAILKLGTKDVLVATRGLPFGSDVHRIDNLDQLAAQLPARNSSRPGQQRPDDARRLVRLRHRGHTRRAARE